MSAKLHVQFVYYNESQNLKVMVINKIKTKTKFWVLVFDPTWPIFKFGLDIVKTYILTQFHKNPVTKCGL